MRWQLFSCVAESFHHELDVVGGLFLGGLVTLGKHDTEWPLPFAELVYKLNIGYLRLDPAIDENKYLHKISSMLHILCGHFLPFSSFVFGDLGITITWEIDEISCSFEFVFS